MTARRDYQRCTRCIMDTDADRSITFDGDGLCCHCSRYDSLVSARISRGDAAKEALGRQVEKIKRHGKGRDYDCIVGVSGGVDSTYVAYLVKQLGLRPLAVHFDNGWNSELAVKNIELVLTRAKIDLFTYVVDWSEFRDLQLSFLKASTPDGDIPTDHAISALLWNEAVKRGIRYIISGMNFATESISVPDWAYGHSDWRYIKDVHRRFGSRSLQSYPHFSLPYLCYINLIRRVRVISILNYVEYDRARAMKLLQEELGWTSYGGKHHESVYTRFYQGYVLPKKFGVDKRYGHLSDLINAGQITTEHALGEMMRPTYPEDLQQQDLVYVTKKLGLTCDEFDAIMKSPVRSFRDYRNSFAAVQLLRRSVNILRSKGLYPK
ncbi:N-acetyl sugar amidotransferase [Ramlibacter sp. AW1]|uniref:N-acetyl sugar amidotransferase n=1 Tax=Ramlibacter aurantiacus TaxID=2801330 RepID=A0A936ZLM8_9BURK|nr:N-acetyl sugar amidotransferase [Ramlibacter aurantiacus]MBL0419553.1 N-acetyl sugar amidotransferase [Ramlibacter aurantiacus]